MEETDMTREEIKAQDTDQVVGGAVQFYTNSQGKPRVNITNKGSFDCVADGFFKYVALKNANPEKSEEELVQMAVAAGIIFM